MTLLSNMAKKSFEEALARLEEITVELEDGELSLEKSLKKFDEGIKLADFCNTQLIEAKAKVEILLERDGEETGDEIILMKDKSGEVIGFEKLNYSLTGAESLNVAFEALAV